MKIYTGRYANGSYRVDVHLEDAENSHLCARTLNLRLDLRNHSPTGFAWGYRGSGPAQLALAICADALGNDDHALRVYQDVKDRLIAPLDQDADFVISDTMITAVVRTLRPYNTCRICGCSHEDACATEHGPCRWVETDLCSGCVEAAREQEAAA